MRSDDKDEVLIKASVKISVIDVKVEHRVQVKEH